MNDPLGVQPANLHDPNRYPALVEFVQPRKQPLADDNFLHRDFLEQVGLKHEL